jgi:hypothetical protein
VFQGQVTFALLCVPAAVLNAFLAFAEKRLALSMRDQLTEHVHAKLESPASSLNLARTLPGAAQIATEDADKLSSRCAPHTHTHTHAHTHTCTYTHTHTLTLVFQVRRRGDRQDQHILSAKDERGTHARIRTNTHIHATTHTHTHTNHTQTRTHTHT